MHDIDNIFTKCHQGYIVNKEKIRSYKDKNIKGFIGFDNCSLKHSWISSEKYFLKIISAIISGAYQRRFDECQLIKSKSRFENIIEATDVGTWEWNIQTGELKINDRWAEIAGYTLEELEPISIEG